MSDDAIADAMDLMPMKPWEMPDRVPPNPFGTPVFVASKEIEEKARDDFETARRASQVLIDSGLDAISKLGALADQSQHPRAYEVYAKLIETTSNAAKDLMQLHKDLKDLEGREGGNQTNIEKAVFIGSTFELEKVINNLRADVKTIE